MITSKVKSIDSVKSFDGKYGLVYFLKLTMDNGDTGQVARKTETGVKVGDELTYTLETNGQYGNNLKEEKKKFEGGSRRTVLSKSEIALGYAKDLAIARWQTFPNEKITLEQLTNATTNSANILLKWLEANDK